MRKAVLPKLRSLLRHGCHGSAATSFPALLPLLALLPASLLGPSPDLPAAILESTWLGVEAELQLSQQPGGGLAIQGPGAGSAGPAGRGGAAGGAGGRAGMPAAAEAYQECLAWLLGQAERLAASPGEGAEGGKAGAVETGGSGAAASAGPGVGAGAARGYCEQLLQSTLVPQVLPLVLPTGQEQGQVGGASQAVKDVALQLLAGCTGKVLAAAAAAASPACGGVSAADREGPSPGAAALEACLEAAVSAAAGIVAGAPPPPTADPSAAAAQAAPAAAEAAAAAAAAAIESLLQRLKSVPPSTPTLGAALAARLAGAATRQLLAALDAARAGDRPELPAAASSLLARLVRGFGAGMSAGK